MIERESMPLEKQFLEKTALASIILDAKNRIVVFNPAAERLWGYRAAEVLALHADMLLPDNGSNQHNVWDDLFKHETIENSVDDTQEIQIECKDHRRCWVRLVPSKLQRGKDVYYGTFVHDITQEREAREQMYQTLTQAIDAVVSIDENNLIQFFNPAAETLWGYKAEEVIGKNVSVLVPEVHKANHDHYISRNRTSGIDRIVGTFREVQFSRHDGTTRWGQLSISKLRLEDRVCYTAFMKDITVDIYRRQQQLEHERHRASYFDSLTQLPNRVALIELIDGAIEADIMPHPRALCVINIDHFNMINSKVGRYLADSLLIEFANRLKRQTNYKESIARVGGNEFALWVTINKAFEARLSSLQEELSSTYKLQTGHRIKLSLSIGYTRYPDDHSKADTLLRHATQAMLSAKALGGNQCTFFNTQLSQEYKEIQKLRKEIAEGLEQGEFVIEVQPQVAVNQAKVLGVEALIRWQHPHGRRMPDQFLPAIQGTPLEQAVDRWVLKQAFILLDQWRRLAPELKVSINLSPSSLSDYAFLAILEDMQRQYPDVDPRLLCVEVLESTAIAEFDSALEVMDTFRSKGLTVALDDFGTGYSSLAYLKVLPSDIIKIDRSFIQTMLASQNDLAIVESILYLAKRFEKQVIAEGVESGLHIKELNRMGCDMLQGYGVARPMPAGDFLVWHQNWK